MTKKDKGQIMTCSKCGSKNFYCSYTNKEFFNVYYDAKFDEYHGEYWGNEMDTQSIKCEDCDTVLKGVELEEVHF